MCSLLRLHTAAKMRKQFSRKRGLVCYRYPESSAGSISICYYCFFFTFVDSKDVCETDYIILLL